MPAGGRAADGGALRSLSLPFEEVPEAEFPVLVEETGRPALPRFSYDELTGLPNRRSYTRALGEETERARRYGTDLALIWLDVQGLREFNHEHGTLQGDHILAQVAALLHAMVGTQGRLFRFAGPEFVVLFPGANQPTACRLAGALLEGVRKCTVRLLESSRTVRPTMSAGVAVFPQGLADPDNLQEAARRAVQRARLEGRNRLAVHGSERDAARAEAHLAGTFPCPLLVGRMAVLEEILADLSRVGSSGTAPWTPPVVLVKGPLGVGSTRMLAEVAERCRQKGFRILRSEARAATVGQPFATLIRGLEDLLDREPGLRSRLRAGLTELELMALGRLSPMLCSGTPASEPVEVPLRPAFVRMLEVLCREGPLLVLLDDAHRVERTSWQVLHHLWSGKQPGLSICAAAAPTDPEAPPEAEGHPLREFLEEIRALQGVREFHLEPLTPVHVRAMLEAILPIPPRDVLVAEVYRRSRGLPLLVQETLKDLLHARQTAPVAGLQPRIEGLDEVSRNLLARAAVLGTRFHLETLLAVEDLDEGFLRGLLDRACGLELLEERDLGESFRFTSEHLRRDLEQSLPEQERRAIHLEIVRVHREACSLRPDGALSELAYHLRRAHDLAGARRVELQLAELHRRVSGTGEIVRGRPAEPSQAPGPDHPLSPAEWALVMEIVRLLRMLVKGVRFYGVGHPQVGGTQTELLRVLAQFHRTRSRLDFSEARGVLIINGHPPDAAARRIGRLDLGPSWNLQSLSFVPGVNLSELRALTEALALSPDELKAQAGMAAMLSERGVSHVIPNDRLFVEVGERDVLMRRVTDDGLVLVRPSQALEEGYPSTDPAPGSADGQTAEVPVAELASLMAAREEVAAWYEEMSRYLDLSFVEELSEDWDVLVADLESGNRIKVTAAAKAFLERGEDSIQPLTHLLARSPDARARKVALHLLQRLDDEVVPHLLGRGASPSPGLPGELRGSCRGRDPGGLPLPPFSSGPSGGHADLGEARPSSPADGAGPASGPEERAGRGPAGLPVRRGREPVPGTPAQGPAVLSLGGSVVHGSRPAPPGPGLHHSGPVAGTRWTSGPAALPVATLQPVSRPQPRGPLRGGPGPGAFPRPGQRRPAGGACPDSSRAGFRGGSPGRGPSGPGPDAGAPGFALQRHDRNPRTRDPGGHPARTPAPHGSSRSVFSRPRAGAGDPGLGGFRNLDPGLHGTRRSAWGPGLPDPAGLGGRGSAAAGTDRRSRGLGGRHVAGIGPRP